MGMNITAQVWPTAAEQKLVAGFQGDLSELRDVERSSERDK